MTAQVYLTNGQVSFMDSFLNSVPEPSKDYLLPSLGEEMTSPCLGQDVNIVQDVHHLIPGPGGVLTGNGDSTPVQLLQEDHLVTEAVRKILCLEIPGNGINVKHFRWIVKKLRDNLLQAGAAAPLKVSHRKAYARILMRLSEKLTTLDSEPALSMRPLTYVDCLNTLLENIESGFVIMKQSGSEPDVFVMKDKEPVGYSERLCSLASHLIGCVGAAGTVDLIPVDKME